MRLFYFTTESVVNDAFKQILFCLNRDLDKVKFNDKEGLGTVREDFFDRFYLYNFEDEKAITKT